jgi:hypothetical protein
MEDTGTNVSFTKSCALITAWAELPIRVGTNIFGSFAYQEAAFPFQYKQLHQARNPLNVGRIQITKQNYQIDP